MSAGEQFKALYDFKATGDGMLSFKIGDRFTLVSKSNVDWWVMRSPSGERGLVPVNYVGACEVSCLCVCLSRARGGRCHMQVVCCRYFETGIKLFWDYVHYNNYYGPT